MDCHGTRHGPVADRAVRMHPAASQQPGQQVFASPGGAERQSRASPFPFSDKRLQPVTLSIGSHIVLLGFRKLGLRRISGARSPLNEASARTMARTGMTEEGIIRGHLFTRSAWR